jgi:hypothetical protein
MRRTILWIGGARAFAVVGFAVILAFMLWFAATAPPTTMSSSAAFAQYRAQAFTSSDRSTYNNTFFSCTGELVQIQGTLHEVSHGTILPNGVTQVTFQFNIKGRGESASGTKYVYQDTFTQHQNFSGEPPFIFNRTLTARLISQGSATPTDDLKLNILIHSTVNENGEVTAVVDKFEAVCK